MKIKRRDITFNADPNQKDKFGATALLREKIEAKYEMVTAVGKGSYGCVSKARCRATG